MLIAGPLERQGNDSANPAKGQSDRFCVASCRFQRDRARVWTGHAGTEPAVPAPAHAGWAANHLERADERSDHLGRNAPGALAGDAGVDGEVKEALTEPVAANEARRRADGVLGPRALGELGAEHRQIADEVTHPRPHPACEPRPRPRCGARWSSDRIEGLLSPGSPAPAPIGGGRVRDTSRKMARPMAAVVAVLALLLGWVLQAAALAPALEPAALPAGALGEHALVQGKREPGREAPGGAASAGRPRRGEDATRPTEDRTELDAARRTRRAGPSRRAPGSPSLAAAATARVPGRGPARVAEGTGAVRRGALAAVAPSAVAFAAVHEPRGPPRGGPFV